MASGRAAALRGIFGEMLDKLLQVTKRSAGKMKAAGRRGLRSGPSPSALPSGPRPHPKSKISPADFDRVRTTPKGARPDPSTYMKQADIDAHLKAFRDSGAVRFADRNSVNSYGTLGPPGGTYTIPKSEFDNVMQRTGGDLGKVETELGLEPGTLTSGNTMIAHIEPKDMGSVRMPSGNEKGANQHWLPGGYTSGGVPEATVDTPKGFPYKEIRIRPGGPGRP